MTDLPAYHARLPYGQRVSPEPVLGNRFFPFEGDIQVRPLEEPIVPEPPRMGAAGGEPCAMCAEPEQNLVWRGADWMLHTSGDPIGLPMILMLSPVAHVTLHSMPPELLAGLGPMIQRVVKAISRIEGIGRVHFHRYGDGAEHFHMWFLARPLGMMQLRGPMLAVWDDLLPHIPDDELRANIRLVAEALAAR
jgi:diadenosine tetraphosphate (Ap4A) HIT family hydrolase